MFSRDTRRRAKESILQKIGAHVSEPDEAFAEKSPLSRVRVTMRKNFGSGCGPNAYECACIIYIRVCLA